MTPGLPPTPLRTAFLVAALLAIATPCGAQRPAAIAGHVVDAVAGVPVDGARVVLVEAAMAATSDAAGAFTLRGVDPGRHRLRIGRFGYADTTVVVSLARGRALSLWISLRPLPGELRGVSVRSSARDGTRLDRAAIERTGARTAGDVVASVAGVVVRSTSAGGAQTASIRGSDAAAVLVLLDGTALNDPVTGVADLSGIAASSIESVTVLPGARSARYGARAEAGVIAIETRRSSAAFEAEAFVGSLGSRGARVQVGGRLPAEWTLGGSWHGLRGGFDFALPRETGGGGARRTNADARAADAFAAASFPLAGGDAGVRAGAGMLERGLPGKGFAPSATARESLRRAHASARWERSGAAGSLHATVSASVHRTRIRDADPPFGFSFDDTTRLRQLEARLAGERRVAAGRATLGAGADVRVQSIRSNQLAGDAPADLWYGGLFAHGGASASGGHGTLSIEARARLDHDPGGGGPVASHALTAGFHLAAASIQLAHRSSYSPPGLDDQFFRDAVGVAPNPHLRPERVPSEIELRATAAHAWGDVVASSAVAAFAGDVHDMIVWSPDYRFVWSPRNVDVRRRGVEAAAAVEAAGFVRAVRASYGYARISYAAARDDAQLEYRPRHTAQVRAEWAWSHWSGAADAHYTGARYPAAARVNALPGFWTLSADVARTWRAGPWALSTSLRIDRVLDEKDALIFGFPDAGRVAELRVRVSRLTSPSTSDDS